MKRLMLLPLAVIFPCGPAPPRASYWDRVRTEYGKPVAHLDVSDVTAKADKYVGKLVTVRGIVERVDLVDREHSRVILRPNVSCDLLHLAEMARECKPGDTVILGGVLKRNVAGGLDIVPAVVRQDESAKP